MTDGILEFALDEDIDRRVVPALKTHPMVVGKDGAGLFAGSVADMDFKAAPAIVEALEKRLQHNIYGYEAVPDGLFPALQNWLRARHNWHVEANHILRAPNVLNILAIAASLFTSPGDGIIVQPPVFFDFYDIVRENHRTVINNPLIFQQGRYTMDFDGLEKLAADPKNKMLYLCNPHNPIGRVWTREELCTLGNICARHNVLVVSDEIHGDIIFSGHAYTPFASLGADYAHNVISCVSPAKSFNIAGCCSAFTIIADDTKRKAFQTENSRLTVNKNNAFASVAMQAAYEHGEPWLDAVLAYLENNLDVLRWHISQIPKVTLIEPEGTFLAWLDFRGLGMTPDEITGFLRTKAGWVVSRGQAFGTEGQGFARLNFACTRVKLEAALERLSGATEVL